jgi:hypothetical protein
MLLVLTVSLAGTIVLSTLLALSSFVTLAR